ncbi:MAG TPA: hypothetical protein VF212_03590 [Longimicrobiales bacterium]
MEVVSRAGWTEHVEGAGKIRLDLPPEFTRIDPDSDHEQVLWQKGEDHLVLLSIHDGTFSTVISPDGVGAVEQLARCSVEVAGRVAEVYRAWLAVGETRYFSAAVDVAVEQGFGVGAAILSSDAQAWRIFVGLLQSIEVTESR